jgi:hypothetical protein
MVMIAMTADCDIDPIADGGAMIFERLEQSVFRTTRLALPAVKKNHVTPVVVFCFQHEGFTATQRQGSKPGRQFTLPQFNQWEESRLVSKEIERAKILKAEV